MKISNNAIGNYSPLANNNSVKQTKLTSKTNGVESNIVEKPKSGDLTSDEKNFFMKVYPQNKSEIIDYHFYQKNGKMSGNKIGSLFNRRG